MCVVRHTYRSSGRPTILNETISLCRGPRVSKDSDLTEIDHEEQNAGYSAAYSRFGASDTAPTDPVAWVSYLQAYLDQELIQNNPRVESSAADPAAAGPFLEYLTNAGLVI